MARFDRVLSVHASPAPVIPHPATSRQSRYGAWTEDPAIPALVSILVELNAVGMRLDALREARADLDAGGARSEIGAVAITFERCAERQYAQCLRTRAQGGACAALWELIGRRRQAWIDARLEVEGYRPFSESAAKDRRQVELAAEAVPVEAAWALLCDAAKYEIVRRDNDRT